MRAKKPIFLDYNATHVPHPDLWAHVEPYTRLPLNPISMHTYGQEAKNHVRHFSIQIADLLGVAPLDLIFTSGATESNNLGVLGTLGTLIPHQHGAVYFSATAHPSITQLAPAVRDRGFAVQTVPVCGRDRPIWDMDRVRNAFAQHKPILVAGEMVNNEYGAIQPIDALYHLALEYGSAIHIDAVQAFGKIPVFLAGFSKASVAFSGHKYRGFGGHGLLVKPADRLLHPMIVGGSQQNHLRAGTVSMTMVAAQASCMRMFEQGRVERSAHTIMLQQRLESGLQHLFATQCPGEILGVSVPRIANTTMFRFAGISAETLLMVLDMHGVMVSAGSACGSGAINPSSALLTLGISESDVLGFLRVSTSELTTVLEIDEILRFLGDFLRHHREQG